MPLYFTGTLLYSPNYLCVIIEDSRYVMFVIAQTFTHSRILPENVFDCRGQFRSKLPSG